jgi:hypothetical protein
MNRHLRRVRCFMVPLAVAALVALVWTLGLPRGASGSPPEDDPSLKRTRAQAKMLDDLFKVAVVDITKRYDGPPAAKVAKAMLGAAQEKEY